MPPASKTRLLKQQKSAELDFFRPLGRTKLIEAAFNVQKTRPQLLSCRYYSTPNTLMYLFSLNYRRTLKLEPDNVRSGVPGGWAPPKIQFWARRRRFRPRNCRREGDRLQRENKDRIYTTPWNLRRLFEQSPSTNRAQQC